jgi:hypothetical protein
MKKRILFLIIPFMAWGLYAQEVESDPADSVVEELEAIAAESAETAREQAVQAEAAETAETERSGFSGVWDYFTAPAATRHNEPFRYFELGFDAGAGFGNNLVALKDILKKHVEIDLNDYNDKLDTRGVAIGFDGAFHSSMNIGSRKKGWIGGSFINVDGRFDAKLPKSLITLLTVGNEDDHNPSGEFNVSGAVFAEAGLRWTGNFLKDKLRLGIAPSWYLPVLYIPKSSLGYSMDTETGLDVAVNGDMRVYMPFSYDDGVEMSDWGGIDLSFTGEYALFPILDVGGTISHVPLVPALLSRGVTVSFEESIIHDDNLFDGIEDISSPDPKTEEFSGAKKVVLRPLRFDVYALYRPFRKDILTIKPSIGFTVLNPSEEAYFNGMLEFQVNIGRILFLSLGTGREEGYWRHRAGFALNMRVLELDITGALKSQSYLKSYQLSGTDVTVGLKFGY